MNGRRIFPRGNVDDWSFALRKGQTVTCEVNAARLGSPLDARVIAVDDARLGLPGAGEEALGGVGGSRLGATPGLE